MQKQLEQTIQIARDEIRSATTLPDLANLKSKYLGKNSQITDFLKRLRELPQEERPAFGAIINEAKKEVEELIDLQEKSLVEKEYVRRQEASRLDLTLPGRRNDRGALHPLTQVWREIEDNFISLGFEIAEGFDVEDQFHNFDALNTPKDHPSRNLADTFFITESTLLRTQTSTVQVRTMEGFKPPIRIISPGRCYRNDKLDASHSPVFHQVEALVVDEGITFADLRDTLNQFAVKMFGPDIKSRFRPHFFPFTEPSAEIDISCVSCGGRGCRICKGSGWLEMGGAGMVDPNVFEILGIDPERYSGFAFGLGIDRIAMLKYNLPDIRLLFENDLRFLRQFK
ncbi:MAG TPA: phenylalanine--tRNA ligase subunit alpha [Candidatus Cloacimonadota bacterium]|nr:phenylalanine--tRNA ligase subunit alpha [Candidatus Cloacimonadota bacterium]